MHACVNVKLTTVNQLLQQYGRDFNPGFSDITIKFSFFGVNLGIKQACFQWE